MRKSGGNRASGLFTDSVSFYLKDNREEKEVGQNLILAVRLQKGETNVWQVRNLFRFAEAHEQRTDVGTNSSFLN